MTERESMPCDVVIVGGGPAGLSAAIRLKQINEDLEVVVLEKGSEIGAHILSGAVIEPEPLDDLLPGGACTGYLHGRPGMDDGHSHAA